MSNSIPKIGLLAVLLVLPSLVSANADQWVSYGQRQLQSKQFDDAIQSFNKALTFDQRSAQAYQGLGTAYLGKGDKAKAIQYYKYAVQLNPGNTQLSQYVTQLEGSGGGAAGATAAGGAGDQAYQYGNAYLQRKQYQYAAQYFSQAIQANPQNSNAYYGRGMANYNMGQTGQAIADFDAALALKPNPQLKGWVDQLRASAPAASPSASAAPAPAASASPAAAAPPFNPWIMGGAVAALAAVMLLVF